MKPLKRLLAALAVVSLFFVSPYFSVPLHASFDLITTLESFWALEEASGTRFDDHASNDLTDNNGVSNVGGVAHFTGASTQYLNHADNADLSCGDNDCTWQFWANADTLNGSSGFPVVGSKGSPFVDVANEFVLYHSDGVGWNFAVGNGAGALNLASTAGAASTNVWYCIHVWHNSVSNEIGISVNAGTPDTSSYSGGIVDSANDFIVGAAPDQGLYWDGRIGKVGFWRKILTSDERTWLYNGGTGRSYAEMVTEAGGGGGPTCNGGLLLRGVGGC